jgi:transcriptional regulator of acetoin/glycerol metabolism
MAKDTLPYSVEDTVDSTRLKAKRSPTQTSRTRARLISAFPLDLAVIIDLGQERTVLGRLPDDDSTPPINHPTVSRSHFAIEWDAPLGAHVGMDLESRNGSAVHGQRAGSEWQPLTPGCVLRVGDVLLVYEQGHTHDQPDPPEVSRRAIPGEAMEVRKLRTQLARAAPDLSPILIIGETGTGKELIASEVHRLSHRKGELVAINCATFGEHLIESQLFGHVKGAFTGATTDQAGLFRAAEGGTLFLDEIGEMPKELQPKLLRAIQEKEVRAVGSSKSEKVDVRVVAATHQNLAQRAHAGTFRQDLYARLALWEVHVPPVRQRRGDVLTWVRHLHDVWTTERNAPKSALVFHAEAAEALLLSSWPENLRGLNRFVHEISAQRLTEIRVEHLPSWMNAPGGKS